MNQKLSSAAASEEDSSSVPPTYNQAEIDRNNPFYKNSMDNASINRSIYSTLDHEKQVNNSDGTTFTTEKVSTKWKFILRILQMIFVVGSFGFQASANSWSGRNSIPFDSVALLFFFYAVEWFAFIWSAFCTYVCLSIRFNKNAGNIKPAVGFAMDTLLAVLLGIGISMEIGTYTCPPGEFNGWCNFYNVGLCFGMVLFLSFGVSSLWDLFSGLSCLRTKPSSSNLV